MRREKRRGKDEERPRGEREKQKLWSGSRSHCCLVLNQLRGSHSWCHAMVFGGRPDALPPPGGWRWLLRSRAAGSQSAVPCSTPDMAECSRLRPPGERRRLIRSLSDGSHPTSTQEHSSGPCIPPVLLLLQHHRLGQPLAVSASSCCPTSSAPRSPSAVRVV